MANFPNQQLTDLGWDAISEQNVGRRLLFNRVQAGDGYPLPNPPPMDPDDLTQMTDLVSYVMDLQIAGMVADGHGRATIYATLMSKDVPNGFYLRELGIIGQLDPGTPTEELPILYSVCNARDQATYIPGATETSKVVLAVEIHIIVGRALNIDVTVTAGTIRAINLGDPLRGEAVFAQQTGLIQEFRRLRSPDGSIKLDSSTGDYVDITGGLVQIPPGQPGGPDDGGPIDPDSTLVGLVPVGTILPYSAAAAPAGYFVCNGQAVSRVTYARLFSIILGTYGAGDGATTFNVPNIQGRTPIGSGTGAGLTPRGLGALGGVETHILLDPEMPFHNHSGTAPDHLHSFNDGSHNHGDPGHNHPDPGHSHTYFVMGTIAPGAGASGAVNNGPTTTSTNVTNLQPSGAGLLGAGVNCSVGVCDRALSFVVDPRGGSQPHINMQPFIVVNYIIKY